jgi:hypothetical protein
MRLSIAFATAALIASGTAQAAVSVTFVAPENFTDASLRNYSGASRQTVLRELQEYIVAVGERHVAPNQVLRMEILDVDLAGRFEPWRGAAYEARYLRDETWPKITVRYVLEDGGRILSSGSETIVDHRYLRRPVPERAGTALRYERAMLDDWFRARFPGRF